MRRGRRGASRQQPAGEDEEEGANVHARDSRIDSEQGFLAELKDSFRTSARPTFPSKRAYSTFSRLADRSQRRRWKFFAIHFTVLSQYGFHTSTGSSAHANALTEAQQVYPVPRSCSDGTAQ